MGKTHQYIAAPYELEAAQEKRLSVVIMPLQKYFNFPVTKVRHNGIGTGVYSDNFVMGFLENMFSEGDRLYLAEEWDTAIGPMGESFVSLTKQQHPQWTDQWQPAHTMPPEAAQHWFAITDVRVCQWKDTTPDDFIAAGLYPRDFRDLDCFQTVDAISDAQLALATAYPELSEDSFIVVLEIQFSV